MGKKISYKELVNRIDKGKFDPVYFFYGEEDLVVQEVIDRIKGRVISPGCEAFNFNLFYGDQATGEAIVGAAQSFPLMSPQRLVVVKRVEKLGPSDRNSLLKYCQHPVDSTLLIIILIAMASESGWDSYRDIIKKDFFRRLTVLAVGVEFRRLGEAQIQDWIRERFRAKGKSIRPHVADFILQLTGPNLLDVANEVEKVLLYVGDREKVEEEDVKTVVGVSKRYNVFELCKAVGKKDLSEALKISQRLIGVNMDVGIIIRMLFRHFYLLWQIEDLKGQDRSQADIARVVRVSPYYIGDYLDSLKHYTLPQISGAFAHLLDADLKLKTGYQDTGSIVHLLIHSLIRTE